MKARSPDWLTLARALASVREDLRHGVMPALEKLAAPTSIDPEAAGLVAHSRQLVGRDAASITLALKGRRR